MSQYNIDFSDERLSYSQYSSFANWFHKTKRVGRLIEKDLTFNVVYLNIRSLNCNWDELVLQIKAILYNGYLDILILSELFCSEEELKLVIINNFKTIYKLRPNKRGGGLLVYYNNNTLLTTPIDINTRMY